jgi:hypothetical protein
MTSALCPPPPARYQAEPMTVADAKHWIASYNAWVEVWNRHERDRDLPLSPEWSDAYLLGGAIPASVLAFKPRTGQSHEHLLLNGWGFIRLRKWRPFHRGWSYCRTQADPANIVWACWPGPHWR